MAGCRGLSRQSDVLSDKGAQMQRKVEQYATFRLTTDVTQLTGKQKEMIPILIEAAQIMDELFWYEAHGNREKLLRSIDDVGTRRFIEMNYGPWDRLDGNKAFLDGVGEKPKGANFYPQDMTKDEFEAADLPDKASLYTFVRRGDDGMLRTIPYHKMFETRTAKVSELLRKAA